MQTRILALFLSIVPLPQVAASAVPPHGEPTFEEERDSLHRNAIEELAELIGQCEAAGLRELRRRLVPALERLAPEHRLRRCPKDPSLRKRREELALELEARWEELKRSWRRELMAMFGAHELEPEEELALWRDVLTILPDDDEARRSLGEVRGWDERWILEESQAARDWRAGLEDALLDLVQEAGPRACDVASEPDSPVEWTNAFELKHGVLRSNLEERKGRELAQAVWIAQAIHRRFLGEVPLLRTEYTIYVMRKSSRETFLAGHPRARETDRAGARRTAGAWMDDDQVLAIWSDAKGREEALVQQVIAHMLRRTYRLEGESCGWGQRALTRRLEELTLGALAMARGKRMPRDGEKSWRDAKSKAHRLAGSLELLAAARGRADVRGKDTPELLGYAWMRYLLEGDRESVSRCLDGLGRGRTLEEVLRLPTERLERRFARWVREVD